MAEVSASWEVDDLGPAKVVFLRPCAGVEAVVVIDNVALGPAIGGVRMRPDVTAHEVARLARAMTVKNAVCGLASSALLPSITARAGARHSPKSRRRSGKLRQNCLISSGTAC